MAHTGQKWVCFFPILIWIRSVWYTRKDKLIQRRHFYVLLSTTSYVIFWNILYKKFQIFCLNITYFWRPRFLISSVFNAFLWYRKNRRPFRPLCFFRYERKPSLDACVPNIRLIKFSGSQTIYARVILCIQTFRF